MKNGRKDKAEEDDLKQLIPDTRAIVEEPCVEIPLEPCADGDDADHTIVVA